MAKYFDVHPVDPQPRAIGQAVEILRSGGLIAYPTDDVKFTFHPWVRWPPSGRCIPMMTSPG